MHPWTSWERRSGGVSLTNIDATDTRSGHLRRYYVPSYAVMLCWQGFMQSGGEFTSFEVILINAYRLMIHGCSPMVPIQLNWSIRLRWVALCAFLSNRRISIPSWGSLNVRIVWTDTSFRGRWHSPVRNVSWSLVSASPNRNGVWVLYNLNVLLTYLFNLNALLINGSRALITKVVTDFFFTSFTATSMIISRV